MDLIIHILAMFIGFHAIYFYITKFSRGIAGILFILGIAIGLNVYLDYINIGETTVRLVTLMFGVFLFSLDMIYGKIMHEIKENNKL